MRKKNYLFLFLIVFLLSSTIVFGQSTSRRRKPAAPSTYELTVNANVKAYQVLIEGKAIKGNSITVEAGTYEVKVRANGYFDWQTNVEVNSNKTINATLQPIQYQLSIDSNISGAKVFINGNSR